MVELRSNAEKLADQARELPNFKDFPLPGVKEHVAQILDMIGRVEGIFSTYTKHDISHIDTMLDMLDWLVPPSTKEIMSPVEWLLITLSVYLHDLGMVVTADEYFKREENPLYNEFREGIEKDPNGKDYLARVNKSMTTEEKEKFFYQEFVRSEHAKRIREWISGRHSTYWGENVKPVSDKIAELLKPLPTRFREHLATVCESHHKEDLHKVDKYSIFQPYGNHAAEAANVQYAAIMLRTVDLLHVTKDRTPSIMYKTLRLSDPKGVDEWKKQQGTFSVRMKTREFNPNDIDSHVISISADFSEERPYFVLAEYLTYAEEQITLSKRWVEGSQKDRNAKNYWFPWHSVKGSILVEGNEPVQMNFEFDRGRLLDLLVGHTIYNDPTVAVRELLQNAIDAVRYQHYHDKKWPIRTEKKGFLWGKPWFIGM